MSNFIDVKELRPNPIRMASSAKMFLAFALLAVTTVGPGWASQTRASDASSSVDLQVLSTSIASDNSGNIYYTDTAHSSIYELSNTGTQTQIQCCVGIAASLNQPRGIALDPEGDLYIANTGNNQVIEIASSSKASIVNTGFYSLSRPSGVSLDANGDIYIADSGNNRIIEVATTGGQASIVDTGSYQLSNPSSVSVGLNNTLYIADTGNDRIVAVPASGAPSALFTNLVHGPLSITTDNNGNAYIAQTTTNVPSQGETSGSGSMPTVVSSFSKMDLNVDGGGGSQRTIASANVTLTPMSGFNGTLYLSVVGLPPNVVMQLTHPIVSFKAGAPIGDVLQVGESTAAQQTRVIIDGPRPPVSQGHQIGMAMAGLLPFSVLILIGFRASSRKMAGSGKVLGIITLLLLLPALTISTSGCAGGYPAGLFGTSTYTATLVAKPANGQPYSLGSFGITVSK